jgi:hypothetical protein
MGFQYILNLTAVIFKIIKFFNVNLRDVWFALVKYEEEMSTN